MVAKYIDAVLWVGNSPHQYRTVQQFQTEAELRGCCRQLDCVHGWMKSGESKIFLAHRDGHTDPATASLFGYFVLDRIEIIVLVSVAMQIRNLSARGLLSHRAGESATAWPRDVNRYVAMVRDLRRRRIPPDRIKAILREKLRHKHIPRLAAGEFSKPVKLGPTDEDVLELFEDVLKEIVKEWWDEKKESRFTSHDFARGESHRGCTLRKGPGAVYAVDALCVATHDRYHELLARDTSKKTVEDRKEFVRELARDQKKTWDAWFKKNRPRPWTLSGLMGVYAGPFLEAVRECHFEWKPKHLMDSRLRGKASQCGELVVFKEPFPFYRSSPKASFRGALRVDGNGLIKQIAARKNGERLILRVPYYGEEEVLSMTPKGEKKGQAKRIATKGQLAALLGNELHESKATSIKLLNKVRQVAEEQLRDFDKFKIPGIGTIRIHGRKGRRRVKFIPAKAISRIV